MAKNKKTKTDGGAITHPQLKRTIIVGVGGGGNNTVNRLIRNGVSGCEFIAINTDLTHLNFIHQNARKILIGESTCNGQGAEGDIEKAAQAATGEADRLENELQNARLVFVCAGLGGGTGTGAAPVIAEIARKNGAHVVACVTCPFNLERGRMANAKAGLEQLRQRCDAVIVLDNNRLSALVPNLPMNEAFAIADEMLAKAIGSIIYSIQKPSLLGFGFGGIRDVLAGGRIGFISIGEGKNTGKVQRSIEGVFNNHLLDANSETATHAMVSICGGDDFDAGGNGEDCGCHRGEDAENRNQMGRAPHSGIHWQRGSHLDCDGSGMARQIVARWLFQDYRPRSGPRPLA